MNEISLSTIQSTLDQKHSRYFYSSRPSERINEAWVAGSIIGTINNLNVKRIEKQDLLEYGESIIKRME